MGGERDLKRLIRTMEPVLQPDVYVFATLQQRAPRPDVAPLMTFEEAEGTTWIVTEAQAKAAGLPYDFRSRQITLNVHSALEAVGFIAAVARALTEEGIGTNPVSGFYHDHLFVPADRAEDAMEALAALSKEQGD